MATPTKEQTQEHEIQDTEPEGEVVSIQRKATGVTKQSMANHQQHEDDGNSSDDSQEDEDSDDDQRADDDDDHGHTLSYFDVNKIKTEDDCELERAQQPDDEDSDDFSQMSARLKSHLDSLPSTNRVAIHSALSTLCTQFELDSQAILPALFGQSQLA